MLKKPPILALGFVFAAVALTLVFTGTQGAAAVNNKKERAERLWKMSGHADKDSEVFKHWDAEGSVPTTCAKCHSTPGFKDFLGADGTAGGVVDKAAALGTTVECEVCHIDRFTGILRKNSSVQFPSGAVVNDMGPEGLCMECHQGRASKATIDTKIASSGVANEDTAGSKLSFSNIHYYAAAASQFGTVVKGGYEYAGHEYDARFSHIPGYNACNTCHNPHSLEVNLKACNTCHVGVTDPKDIRYIGSMVDYDGDGDIEEGLYYEVKAMQAKLYEALRSYAKTVVGKPIAYDPITYPYFFNDVNGNGKVDTDEAISANGYTSFTVRSLKAAYNYQVVEKDPNGYAHNGKYLIEIMYDGLVDLNTKLVAGKMDLSLLARGDEGHFDGSGMPFRDWDDSGTVPGSCAKCHSATGLAKYLDGGQVALTQGEPTANGFLCITCHTTPPAVRSVPSVLFPSGLAASLGDSSNLCMICHQGRQSKVSVDTTINVNPNGRFNFLNIHYFPEAAIFLGAEVKGGYEFAGKSYTSRQPFANHGGRFNTCVQCHMSTMVSEEEHNWTMRAHNVAAPMKENCVSCHGQDISQASKGADPTKFKFSGIRPANIPDYDADGNIKEAIKDEILGLEDALYAQIRMYTAATLGTTAVYNADTNPYWFKDLNGNGMADANEAVSTNRYSFDAKGLRAAYNYQVSHKAPHGYIHNALYVAQIMVDAIQYLGGDIQPYTWR